MAFIVETTGFFGRFMHSTVPSTAGIGHFESKRFYSIIVENCANVSDGKDIELVYAHEVVTANGSVHEQVAEFVHTVSSHARGER